MGRRREPPGWTAPVTEESVADCDRLADLLLVAADSPNGHVPSVLAEQAVRARVRAAQYRSLELRELLVLLDPEEQQQMSHELALLCSGLMRHRDQDQRTDQAHQADPPRPRS